MSATANTQAMERLAEALEANTATMQQYLAAEQQRLQPWADADEAARLLGLSVSKSRKHVTTLSAMIRRGQITQFRGTKKLFFWKEELRRLAEKRAAGRVAY